MKGVKIDLYFQKIFSLAERRMVVARGWGGGKEGVSLFNGYRDSVLQHEKFLEICHTTRHI